jgi:outer membrane beta-barrel protein
MKKSIWILLAFLISAHAFADEIEVPEEELARESTLPVFNKRRAVLNRSVLTNEKFELGAGGGLEMNEPYYNTYMFNVQGTYNYTETSAVNIEGLFWMPGLSSYGEQLKAGGKHESFDAAKAPHPQWAFLANYEYVAYYGKISLTKQTVMNLNLFGLAGLGYINMGAVGVPALNLGLGQNFFITNSIGLRADLRWLIFQGPNPASQHLRATDNPAPSSFDTRIFYNTQMGLAVVIIL